MELLDLKSFDRLNCPIYKSIGEFGDYWSLLIIRESFLGTKRFYDYEKILGVSKSVLTRKIKLLVEKEILKKVEYQEPSQRKRYEYKLTQKGKELFIIIAGMIDWGNKYLVDKNGDRANLVDKSNNDEVHLELLNTKGEIVGLNRLKLLFYKD